MPRRLALGATAAALSLLWLCACGHPGEAHSATGWIEVSPGTVAAGDMVNLRAQCAEPNRTAVATSEAFGLVTMHQFANRLNAEARVADDAAAGRYLVTLRCPSGRDWSTSLYVTSGNRATATATGEDRQTSPSTATVGPATMGPHTGGGFLANGAMPALGNPLVWLAAGMGAFLAATVIALRSGRRRQWRGSARHRPNGARRPPWRRQPPWRPFRAASTE